MHSLYSLSTSFCRPDSFLIFAAMVVVMVLMNIDSRVHSSTSAWWIRFFYMEKMFANSFVDMKFGVYLKQRVEDAVVCEWNYDRTNVLILY